MASNNKKPTPRSNVSTPNPVVPEVVAPEKKQPANNENVQSVTQAPFGGFQELFRENTEKSLGQARARYAQFKNQAEQATDKLEVSLAAANAGAREFSSKILEFYRHQTSVNLELVQSLVGVKNVEDVVKLQQDFVKDQVSALQNNAKELTDMVRKIAENVVEPVKDSMILSFKN